MEFGLIGMTSGRKSIEGNYKNGKQEGLHTWWYDNGQKVTDGNYKDGVLVK
jgi:hypothetical protein